MADSNELVAVRTAYDVVAADYSTLLKTALDAKPFDRAVLVALADQIKAGPLGRVADLGCGPGHVTAFLHAQGLDVFGVDLSPQMVAVARRDYPDISFQVGSMGSLDLDDGALGGITAWYSIIHTPLDALQGLFDDLSRVLAEGAWLALAFQAGAERVHVSHAYGHDLSLDAYRLDPSAISDLLGSAGLQVQARLEREPDSSERTRQAYLLARKTTR